MGERWRTGRAGYGALVPRIEPPSSLFRFPDPLTAGAEDLVAVGGDLAPGTVLSAYRMGMFPMHLPDGRLGWWSPVRRGIIPLEGLRVSRSLRRSMRMYTVTVDRAFVDVIDACADPSREGRWINVEILSSYVALHRLGWAHSVETWDGRDLVGGLYGIAIGGLFAGESMFHRSNDASKVALVRLVDQMTRTGAGLLDVQWATNHLVSLGAIEIDRADYLGRLVDAIATSPDGLWP